MTSGTDSGKQVLTDGDDVRSKPGTKKVLLFAAGILAAASVAAVVVLTASILHTKNVWEEDAFVGYDILDASDKASVGKLDFLASDGHAHEDLYINDVTQEQTIKVAHPHYDIFVLKKYQEGREMLLITSKPEEGRPRRVIQCEDSNMTDTDFVPSSSLVDGVLVKSPDVTIENSFERTCKPIKLVYKSCDLIPQELYQQEESTSPALDALLRERREASSYGNWGGRWKGSLFSPCCWGCNHYERCTALNCTPPLDELDRICMDYTFCTKCWHDTPTRDLPHCDCLKDLITDLTHIRCPPNNYRECRLYRSDLKGIMTGHRCWGRLVTKMYEAYHCGYKQVGCSRGQCQTKPEYCVRGKTMVRNNFKCESFMTCEESTRKLGGAANFRSY
ncbi:uncharacterized protein LOC124150806 [Haliotis rufescens]|uniref:uncharacterized protein LOC124150806 n=1 Tax=Haliotis rufescens TaxID=6454 RepID=UPI00201F2630|nr:uncharacterized protein LOC124150806 [Haliotis rufescens]